MKTGKILENFWFEEGKKGIHGVVNGGNIELSTIASINLLLRHFNFDDKNILDAGCGVGRLTPAFSMFHNPKEVIGIDWSETMIEEATKNITTASFQQAPLWDIPFDDKHFDITIAFTSLCHVLDDKFQDALNELSRVTKNELIIVDPTTCSDSYFVPTFFMNTRNRSDYQIPDFDLVFDHDYCLGPLDCPDSLRTLMYFKRREA